MSFPILDNFNLHAKLPIDKRSVCVNLSDITLPYEGLETFQTSDNKNYIYVNGAFHLKPSPVEINVNDYGIYGDTGTDISSQVQTLINNNIGKTIRFPKGVYIFKNIVFDSNVILVGESSETTIFKLPSGAIASDCILISKDFATLTGTNNPSGTHGDMFKDILFDGNTLNTHGSAIKRYGYRSKFINLKFMNFHSNEVIYSEWSDYAGAGNDNDLMEDLWLDIRICYNSCNGLTFKGPHDSLLQSMLIYENTGYGAFFDTNYGHYAATGATLNLFHAYANSQTGLRLNSWIHGINVVSESNNSPDDTTGGHGVELLSGCQWSSILNCDFSNNKHGSGIYVNGASNCNIQGLAILNKYAFDIVSEPSGNGNTYDVIVYNSPDINGTTFNNSSYDISSRLNLRAQGNNTTPVYIPYSNHGWKWVQNPTAVGSATTNNYTNNLNVPIMVYCQGGTGLKMKLINGETQSLFNCTSFYMPPKAIVWWETTAPTNWILQPIYK